ncbi:MAG: TAXI family TRAP transporter solute-binding subunit, partial [Desulfurococcales archaeon]|nr:TAXI family TRAP transporter solute-binding subunit [Desulfurococcales archaeon]
GTYTGLDNDVQTVAVMSMLLVHKDVPKDVVYTMTKILFEHADELKNKVQKQSVQYISLDHALEGLSIPLHEGAYQYYEEQGLQVPAEFQPTG